MSWLLSMFMIAGLVSFVFYNMDQVNRMRRDITYIKMKIDENENK